MCTCSLCNNEHYILVTHVTECPHVHVPHCHEVECLPSCTHTCILYIHSFIHVYVTRYTKTMPITQKLNFSYEQNN